MPEETKTDEQIIREFLEKMSTQDNRATAFPIYYVIRDVNWVITDEDYASGDYRIRYVCNDNYEDVISEEEFDKLPESEDDLTDEQKASEDQADQMTQEDYKRICEQNVWEDHCLFLTETDAQRHLDLNKHHYSERAHTYVYHVWRAPELEGFLLALFRTYNIPPRKDPGTM